MCNKKLFCFVMNYFEYKKCQGFDYWYIDVKEEVYSYCVSTVRKLNMNQSPRVNSDSPYMKPLYNIYNTFLSIY